MRQRNPLWDEFQAHLDHVNAMEGEELDRYLARTLGWEVKPYHADMGLAWPLREMIAVWENGYNNTVSDFIGPNYKPDTNYMTNEGYPLGTTVWYCRIDPCIGGYEYFFHETLPATTLVKAFLVCEWSSRNAERIKRDRLGYRY